jgi:hypothetical protein
MTSDDNVAYELSKRICDVNDRIARLELQVRKLEEALVNAEVLKPPLFKGY